MVHIVLNNPIKVIIAGHGGFAKEIAAWLGTRGVTVNQFLADEDIHCEPIDMHEHRMGEQVLVAIADPSGRKNVAIRLAKRGATFHSMLFNIGPPTGKIGIGSITCPYSVISSNAQVGKFCHLNLHATVGHDVKMGDYCTLSSHVDICGNVEVGEGVFFGSGARVLPGVKIGSWARIGAGAVIVKDVPAGATMYAPAAKRL